MALITCRGVTMRYDGSLALSGLDFEVRRGDYLVILGGNGSGKTTLLRGILGLKKPVEGTIEYGDGLKGREVGYLPQQSGIGRGFPAGVGEIVLSGCQNRGRTPFYSAADRRRARGIMEKLGIIKLEGRSYRGLSGGQQQRVLLARALAAAGELLLLDEPAAGLDRDAAAQMYELLGRLNREDGMTVVMVSHDLAPARENATHILHLAGRMLYFGGAAEYFESGGGRHISGGGDGA